jgi:hypothetical protein
MTDTISVRESGRAIRFTYDDLLKYHGFGYPGGVAHAFKVMQRAFPLLDEEGAPERADLSMATAFPGPGARDAFEMATRMVTGGRYLVDPALAGEEVLRSPKGRYLFRFAGRSRSLDLTLRPGFVEEEFLRLGALESRTAVEEARLSVLKAEMAARLLASPAEDVYDAMTPCR